MTAYPPESQFGYPAGLLESRRAKIMCTIGPSSSSEAVLRELILLGMDVARLNFSHASRDNHARTIECLRQAAAAAGRSICILQDLQGPKIRTGLLEGRQPVTLKTGGQVTITTRQLEGRGFVHLGNHLRVHCACGRRS